MAKDVEIVIAAKNQASKVMEDVGKSSRALSTRLSSMSKKSKESSATMNKSFSNMAVSVKQLVGAFLALKGIQSAFSFFSSSSALFDVQEKAVRGLTNAIQLSGDATGPSIEQHKAFASSLQEVVNVGDEVTLGLMKQASMLGVSNDKLQEVTRATIGLSEATGMSLDASLQRINQAINGNAKSLERYIPALRNASTEEERLAMIQEVAGKGLKQAASNADTAAGSAQRLSNTWGDFKEVIGQALAPVRMLVNSGLNVLVQVVQSAVIPALQNMMPTAAQLTSAMERMKVGIIKAITFVEVVVGNLGNVWEIAYTSVALQITRIVETVKHAFTVQIPGYATWFGRTFANTISNTMQFTVTAVSNHVQQIVDIFSRLWELVTSGFEGGFAAAMEDIGEIAARNLTKGFEAKTEPLPNIAARQTSASEKVLMGRINKLTGNIAKEYKDKLAKRLADAGKDANDGVLDGLDLSAIGGENAIGKKKGSGNNQLSAVESRLLTRGQTQNPMQEIIGLLKNVMKHTKDTADNTERSESELNNRDTLDVRVVS